MSSIKFDTTPMKLKNLIANLTSKALIIPTHQRDFVWKRAAQQGLVDTVLRGIPMPGITIREKVLPDGSEIQCLEDGQQRLTTLRLYMEGAFPAKDGRRFADLTEEEKEHFRGYRISVTIYENATDAEAIEIFMKLQDGSALSIGEKIHSIKDKAPIVGFAQDVLLTPGTGFYDRTTPFWGDARTAKANRGAHTVTAVVICAAVAKGSSEFLCKEGLKPQTFAEFAEFDHEYIESVLEKLIRIFERVNERQPTTSAAIKKQYWEISNFIAYILHGLLLKPEELPDCDLPTHEEQADVWVDFIVRQRLNPQILEDELLCGDKAKGSHFTKERWHRGWLRMFPDCAESTENRTSPTTSSDASDSE